MMMIPSAWENDTTMSKELRDFFRFHASMMEPWDGPASVTFTDGKVIGAVLDRNGLRPEPVLGHRRRSRRHGVRGRRHRRRAVEGHRQGSAAAGQDVPDRHRSGSHRRRRRDQGDARRRAPVRRMAGAGHGRPGRPARTRARRVQPRQRAASPADVRLHARGAEDPDRPDGDEGDGGARLDGHRHAARRAVGASAAAVRLLQAAVRPGDQPAARRDPRRGRHVGLVDGRPRGQPARSGPRVVQAALAAEPDHRQRRAGQDHPHRRRRRPSGPAGQGAVGAVPRRERWRRTRGSARPGLRTGILGDRAGRADPRAVRPQRRHRRRSDPVAAADRGGPPPSRAHQAAHDGRVDRRGRRRPRGASHGAADRVRRRGDQPVSRVRVDRGPDRRGHARHGRPRPAAGDPQLHQGVQQGRAQGDVEDGCVDGRVVHRRADLRSDRPRRRARRQVLHRHDLAARRYRPRRDRQRGRRPPRRGEPEATRGAGPPQARTRRRVPVASRGRTPPVQPRDRLQAPALDAQRSLRHLQGVHRHGRRPVEEADDPARAVRADFGGADVDSDRRGRTGQRDRQALLDRRDELRVDLGRGARDARRSR